MSTINGKSPTLQLDGEGYLTKEELPHILLTVEAERFQEAPMNMDLMIRNSEFIGRLQIMEMEHIRAELQE